MNTDGDVAVLEAVGIAKHFDADDTGPVEAVRNVDLWIEAGEFVGLMGPSGCGKSTLLHLLGALTRPTKGLVRVNGIDLTELSERQLAQLRNRNIGFVFQAFNLVSVLNVEENILLPGNIAGAPKDYLTRRVAEILDAVGLTNKRTRRPAQLSGGEQQRVAIGRALLLEPAILLADEPTGGLDSETGRHVLRVLRDLHQAGQTILLVTHDPTIASQTERILFMRDGEIVNETRPIPGRDTSGLVALIQFEEN